MGASFYERRKASLPQKATQKDIVDRHKDKANMAFYNDKRWRKIRAIMLRKYPVCPDPFGIHIYGPEVSEEVHHIVPIKQDESLAFDKTNVIPLCRRCHRTADAMDQTNPTRQREAMYGALRG